MHVIVSWTEFIPWKAVRGKIKNLWSTFLGRQAGQPGRDWFSGEASRRRVKDQEHFDYLISTYLPKHGGLFWKEGFEPPPRHPVLDDNRYKDGDPPASACGY